MIDETQEFDKPYMQPLYVDLAADDNAKPQPIHLGYRMGINYLTAFADKLRQIGVNHLALNLRFNNMNLERSLERIASLVLPEFHTSTKKNVTL